MNRLNGVEKNDSKCKEIATEAKLFYDNYLNRDSILDYIQNLIVKIKPHVGNCMYPHTRPMDAIIRYEKSILNILPHDESDIKYEEKSIFKNNTGVIDLALWNNKKIIVKTTHDEVKQKEHVHEYFIQQVFISKIKKTKYSKYFNNVLSISKDYSRILVDYVEGKTMITYLKSSDFNIDDFVSIIRQLKEVLQYCYSNFGYIHFDLTPWNIIICKKDGIIYPVMIDYGKSRVKYNGIYHGTVSIIDSNKKGYDILTIISTSIPIILSTYQDDYCVNKLIHLTKHIKRFRSAYQLKTYFRSRQSIDTLLHQTSNDHDYECESNIWMTIYILYMINQYVTATKNIIPFTKGMFFLIFYFNRKYR